MSAEKRTGSRFARAVLAWGLIGVAGIVFADDAEAPDLEFLEYLGSWEESDEDWVALVADAAIPTESEEKEDDETAPNGEKLAELENE